MKSILFFIVLMDFIHADMVGIESKMWKSVPTEIYNDTQTVAMLEDNTNANPTESQWIEQGDTTYEKSAQEVASLPLATLAPNPVNQERVKPTLPEPQTLLVEAAETPPPTTIINNSKQQESIPSPTQEPITETVLPQVEKSTTEQKIEAIINKVHQKDNLPSETTIQETDISPLTPNDSEVVTSEKSIDNTFPITGSISSYTEPIITMFKKNLLFVSYIAILSLVFIYLLLAKPWRAKEEDLMDAFDSFDDDFEIPQLKKELLHKDSLQQNIKEPQQQIEQNTSLLTQHQYATLYGLINETFIYEKEKILLATNKTQDRKNRETIKLEWKFNQILHFSLPKLATDNARQFVLGVKELIINDLTRDIMRVSMKEILQNKTISEQDKLAIEKELAYYETRKEQLVEEKKEHVISDSY